MTNLHAKTRQEVADMYGIFVRTLNRRLKRFEITISKRDRISPKDLQKIYDAMGGPPVSDGG